MSSKIKNITISNLKAISSFSADFNGMSAIITAGNNKGKSTLLRSLQQRLNQIKPSIVLKHDTSEGYERLELNTGEVFIWEFDNVTAAGERLKFITKDANGNELKGPITKEIAKKYFPPTFDVDEFLLLGPAKQSEMLQKSLGLDFTDLNARYKTAYDDRTFANKSRDNAKALLKPVDTTLPTEPVDTSAIQTELNGIDAHNLTYSTIKNQVAEKEGQIDRDKKEITALEKKLKELQAQVKKNEKDVADGKVWLAKPEKQIKGEEATAELKTKLQAANEKNEKIAANKVAKENKANYDKLVTAAVDADKAVEKIQNERADMIRKTKMPEGFGFAEDGNILYNNIPFERQQQSSSAVYIAALKLASMGLGEVKTLYFDCSMLDKNSLSEVEAWANSQGLQLLIERADFDGGEMEYRILDTTVF